MVEPTNIGTQALERALWLVGSVVDADEPLTFAALQEASGLAKSTTSRMLAGLERGGLLEREENGGYVAGSLFWLYAARHEPWERLVRIARPVMERIGSDTDEAVHLSVRRGRKIVQVAQVASRYLLGARDWTQVDVPAHASALGKVFFAWGALDLPPENRLERMTPSTIATVAELGRDGRAARTRGYALTVDELEEGLSGVAVPVRAAGGDIVAALGVSGPTARLTDNLDTLGRALIARAAEVAAVPPREGTFEDPARAHGSGTRLSNPSEATGVFG